MLWLLLIGLAVALLALLFNHDAGTVAGLNSDDFASLALSLALLVVIGSAVVAVFRGRFWQAMQAAIVWTVIGLALVVGYTYRADLQVMADRVLAEVMPGRVAVRSAHTVEVVRGRAGDFQVAAQINGVRVTMILDTGASSVVLTQADAKAAGLPLEVLQYDVAVDTANGRTRAASVTIDRLTIGTIEERAIPALIAQPGALRSSLLGMSFLNRLESWEVRGDKMQMRGHP